MSDELYYLRSILGNLREIKSALAYGPTLAGEVLADNINWLDCYIDAREKGNAEVANFLDRLAARLDNRTLTHSLKDAAACRAMVARLREPVAVQAEHPAQEQDQTK